MRRSFPLKKGVYFLTQHINTKSSLGVKEVSAGSLATRNHVNFTANGAIRRNAIQSSLNIYAMILFQCNCNFHMLLEIAVRKKMRPCVSLKMQRKVQHVIAKHAVPCD